MHALTLILPFLSFLSTVLATAPTIKSPNNLYTDGGTYTLDMSSYYNSGTTILNPLAFTITLSRTEPSINYHFGHALQQINYQVIGQMVNMSFVMDGPRTPTSIGGNFYATNANKINVIKLNYVVIEPIFEIYTFTYHWMNTNRDFHNGQFYNQATSGQGPFTMSGLTVWYTIAGFASILTHNQVDLYSIVTAPSATSIDYRFSTITTQPFHLQSVYIGAYIYNTADTSFSQRFAYFTTGTLQNFGSLTLSSTGIRSYNTIVGTQSYHITNQNFYQYAINIVDGASITVSSNVTVDYMQFEYLILAFGKCPSSTKYLAISEGICYATCPIRTSTNSYYEECHRCPTYDCYHCGTDGLCTDCSASDNRQMDLGTQRCLPMSGFYEDGSNSLAPACVSPCVTCTSASACLSCISGKFLSGSTCQNCLYECQTCTSGSQCTACGTSNNRELVSNLCPPKSGFYDDGSNALAPACVSPCVTCTSSSACSSCAPIGMYLSGANTCKNCLYECQTCTSGIQCTGCGTSNNRQLSSNRCPPKSGFYDDGTNALAPACVSPCVTCTSASACSSCISGKYLSGTSCLDCGSNCNVCATTTGICTQCATGYVHISGNNSCQVDCSVISFCSTCSYTTQTICNSCDSGYNLTNNLCTSSSCAFTNCAACTATECISCASGFAVVNGQCYTVCGDGVIKGSQVCDDGNSASNDGCSSSCFVQDHYNCVSQPSVCSISSLSATLQSLLKDESSNAFTANYLFEPGKHPSFSSVDWQTAITQATNLSLSFSSLVYDTSQGVLTVSASYSQKLTQKQLTLDFASPSTNPFDSIANIQVGSTLIADNNLDLEVYQDSVYLFADVVKYFAITIAVGALILFFMGYYAGKLVAIEVIFMFQLTFFSLLTITDLTPTFFSISGLQYSRGYNIQLIDSAITIRRNFYPTQLVLQLINNYNIVFALIILPALAALILLLVNYFCFKNQSLNLKKYSALLIGQITFYGLLFSFYTLSLSAGIALTYISEAVDINTTSIIISVIFLAILVMYIVFLFKLPEFMGEFTSQFKEDSKIQKYYYLYVIVQRILESIFLLIFAFSPQIAVIIGFFIIQLIILIKFEPYKNRMARSILNNICMLAIFGIILLFPYLSSEIKAYGTYAPFFVLGLLLLTLTYNTYYIVQQYMRKRTASNKIQALEKNGFTKRSGSESKRYLNSNKNDSTIKLGSDEGKATSAGSKELQIEDIEDLGQKQAKALRQKINTDFVIENPYIHAFRSNKIKKPSSNQNRQSQSKKVSQSEQLMNGLMQIKQGFNQLRDRKKYQEGPQFDDN